MASVITTAESCILIYLIGVSSKVGSSWFGILAMHISGSLLLGVVAFLASLALAVIKTLRIRSKLDQTADQLEVIFIWILAFITFLGLSAKVDESWAARAKSEQYETALIQARIDLADVRAGADPRGRLVANVSATGEFIFVGELRELESVSYGKGRMNMMRGIRLNIGDSRLAQSNLWALQFNCTDLEAYSGMADEGLATHFYCKFQTPTESPLFNARSMTAADVEQLDRIELRMYPCEAVGEVVFAEGTVTLLINSEIRKEFPIPRQKPAGSIFLMVSAEYPWTPAFPPPHSYR